MTYDELQLSATLVQCLACLRHFYMTHPQPVCRACRCARTR
jgi:hypothetical protein